MKVELSHKDLISLLRGSFVPHDMMKFFIDLNLGSYNGSHDEWKWNYDVNAYKKFTEQELYNFYLSLK